MPRVQIATRKAEALGLESQSPAQVSLLQLPNGKNNNSNHVKIIMGITRVG